MKRFLTIVVLTALTLVGEKGWAQSDAYQAYQVRKDSIQHLQDSVHAAEWGCPGIRVANFLDSLEHDRPYVPSSYPQVGLSHCKVLELMGFPDTQGSSATEFMGERVFWYYGSGVVVFRRSKGRWMVTATMY